MNPKQQSPDSLATQVAEFVFREATTYDELVEILRFRLAAAEGSHIAGFQNELVPGMEVDGFDRCSRHFGLWVDLGDQQMLVGCQRGVYPSTTEAETLVDEIEGRRGCRIPYSDTPIPTAEYWPDPSAIEIECRELTATGKSFAECSRLIIAPEFRDIGLSACLVEAIIATYILSIGVDVGVATVPTHHKLFYRRYGFREFVSPSDLFVPKAGQESSCLAITRDSIPAVRLPRLMTLANQHLRDGCIRFHANIHVPACASAAA